MTPSHPIPDAAQHIGWIRIYAEEMTGDDWRDMALRIKRQLDELEEMLTKDHGMTDEISGPTSGAVSAHNDKSPDGACESDTALPPTAGVSEGARRASEAAMAGNDSRGGVPLRSSCPVNSETERALEWAREMSRESAPPELVNVAKQLLAEHARAERLENAKEAHWRDAEAHRLKAERLAEDIADMSLINRELEDNLIAANLRTASIAALEAEVATLRGALSRLANELEMPGERGVLRYVPEALKQAHAALSNTQGAKATADGEGK